jgi:hypothetical protein
MHDSFGSVSPFRRMGLGISIPKKTNLILNFMKTSYFCFLFILFFSQHFYAIRFSKG